MSKEKGEKYLNGPEKCVSTKIAAHNWISPPTEKKISDHKHNMSLHRNKTLIDESNIERLRKYKLSQEFLHASIKNNNSYETVIDFILGEQRHDLVDMELLEKTASNYSQHVDKLLEFKENSSDITTSSEDKWQAVTKDEIKKMLDERPNINKKPALNTAIFIASQSIRSELKDPAKRYLTIANNFSGEQDLMTISILYDLLQQTDWDINDLEKYYGKESMVIQTLNDLSPKHDTLDLNRLEKIKNNPYALEIKLKYLQHDLNIFNWSRMPENNDIGFLNQQIIIHNQLNDHKYNRKPMNDDSYDKNNTLNINQYKIKPY